MPEYIEQLDQTIEPPLGFGEGTMEAFYALKNADSGKRESVWKTGYPLLDAALPTLERGVVLIGSVENAGKSNITGCLETGVLDNTEGSIAVSFPLDDSREDRIRAMVAARAKLSITDVQIGGALEPDSIKAQWRDWAYHDITTRYKDRLAIIDGECLKGKGGIIKHMMEYIGDVRSMHKDRPLWITTDAFDDIQTGEVMETNESVSSISKALKKAAKQHNCVIAATKHLVKGSGREANTDSLRGYGSLKYDAKVILLCHNDLGENGENAEIFCEREDKPGERAPVFEVRVRKNKAGSFKGLICYRQYPEMYRSEEMNVQEQQYYREAIFGLAAKKKYRKDY